MRNDRIIAAIKICLVVGLPAVPLFFSVCCHFVGFFELRLHRFHYLSDKL